MTVSQISFHGSIQPDPSIGEINAMARLGVKAVFRARAAAFGPGILGQIERRDRVVLLLLDGKRTLENIALLLHRSDLQVAHSLVRLLRYGYIEFIRAPGTQMSYSMRASSP